MQQLSGERLKHEVDGMIASIRDSLLKLGAKRSYAQLFDSLRRMLDDAQKRSQDVRDMLGAYFSRLNSEFGFSLVATSTPELSRFRDDLALIERNYIQYLGLSQAIRLAQPRFLDQFRRMLISRLRVVFEGAASEIELWNRTASSQVDVQLRERRKAFKRRRDSLERIQSAASELELRLGELDAQDGRLASIEVHLAQLFEGARRAATQREFEATDSSPASAFMPLTSLPPARPTVKGPMLHPLPVLDALPVLEPLPTLATGVALESPLGGETGPASSGQRAIQA